MLPSDGNKVTKSNSKKNIVTKECYPKKHNSIERKKVKTMKGNKGNIKIGMVFDLAIRQLTTKANRGITA